MPGADSESDFFARLGRVEALVERLESHPDPAARDGARELLATVLELHARGVRRLLELASGSPDLTAAAREPTLGGLLALHDLHPMPLLERVRLALAELEPRLVESQARSELVSLDGGVVRVLLHGHASLEDMVREALLAAAPDAGEIVVDVAPRLVPLRLPRERAAALEGKG